MMDEPGSAEAFEDFFPVADRYDVEKNPEYKEALEIAPDRNEPPLTTPFPVVQVKKRKRRQDGAQNAFAKVARHDGQNGSVQTQSVNAGSQASAEIAKATDAAPKMKTAEDRKMMAQKMREKRRQQSLAKKKEEESEKARLAAAIANRKKQMS